MSLCRDNSKTNRHIREPCLFQSVHLRFSKIDQLGSNVENLSTIPPVDHFSRSVSTSTSYRPTKQELSNSYCSNNNNNNNSSYNNSNDYSSSNNNNNINSSSYNNKSSRSSSNNSNNRSFDIFINFTTPS